MTKKCPVLVLGGTSSGVGKTSIAVGLMAALRDRGLTVQPFKVGPDFIDPMHHEAATGRPSINLDGWMLTRKQCMAAFDRHTADADIAVVEGVMGLFDGRDGTTESGSTAQIAKWLGAPVILILDCCAVARSAAAIVKGYQGFDPALHLGGLVFNKVGGAAHTKWLIEAVESSGLDVAVLGGIPKDEAVSVPERHLGLHMPHDPTMPPNLIHNLANLVRSHLDLEAVMALAEMAAAVAAGEGEKAAVVAATAAEQVEDPPAPASPPRTMDSPGKPALRSEEVGPPTEEAQVVEAAAAVAPAPPPSSSSTNLSHNAKKKKRKKARQQQRNGGAALAAVAGSAASSSAAEEVAQPAEQPLTPDSAVAGSEIEAEATRTMPPPAVDSALHPDSGSGGAPSGPPVRIAVARDASFCFYYHDNLRLLEQAGAELVPFSPLVDALPGGISGVYLGGGYPEQHAAELADNRTARAGLAAFAAAGGVVYAECGGLMYLSQSIQPKGEAPQPMVGVFPFKTVLPPGKYTMGYVEVETTEACPLFPPGLTVRGQVHHASELLEEHHVGGVVDESGEGQDNWRRGYLTRPQVPGAPEAPEGFSRGHVLASYVHLHFGGCPQLADALVEACRGVDVEAAAMAVAAAEAEAHTLEGACMQITPPNLRLPLNSNGLLAVRSSPEFHRPAGQRKRSVSVDMGRSHAAHAVAQHALALQHQQQQQQQLQHPHHSSLPPSLPKVPSPAATLSKVVSSGSLSNHSGLYHHSHQAAAYAAERASFQSESPMALSPRTVASEGGYVPLSALYFHPSASEPAEMGYAAPHYHPAQHQHQPTGRPPSGLSAGAPPRNSLSHHPSSSSSAQQHQQQQLGGFYAPSAPAGHLPLNAAGLQGYPVTFTGGSSVCSEDGGSVFAGMARSVSWTHLPPGAPGRPSSAAASQQTQQLQYAYALRQQQAAAGGPGFGLVPLMPPRDGAAPALAPGCATPHNWQHSCPPSDKVATLGPGATEIAWALGLGSRVVAVSDTCDYPPDAAARAKAARRHPPVPGAALGASGASSLVGSGAPSPTKPGAGGSGSLAPSAASSMANLAAAAAAAAAGSGSNGNQEASCSVDEQVLARERPGLIVYEAEEPAPVAGRGSGASSSASSSSSATPSASSLLDRSVFDAVAAVGLRSACRVLRLRRSTLCDVLDSMLEFGDAAGVPEEANRAVDKLRARLRRLAGETARAAADNRPRVLVLRSLQPLVAEGMWAGDLITLAGGEAGLQQPGDPPRRLEWKDIVDYAPEVLVVAGMRDGAGPRTFLDLAGMATMNGWWLLPAVKTGAVFVCEEALVRRGGPRLVEGAEALARMVHGDAVNVCCPPRSVLKLSLRPGQRCRPRLLPNYFMAYC